MKKTFLTFGLVCLAASQAGATESVLSTASLSSTLANYGGTARAVGMGGAYLAVADDSSALLWNPAALGEAKGIELAVHHNSWFGSVYQETPVLGLGLGEWGGLAASASYVNYGSFNSYDTNGNLLGSYSPNTLGFGLGWGRSVWSGLSAGVGLKYLQQSIISGSSYNTMAADLGLLYKLDTLSFAVVYDNLGSSSAGTLASDIRLGVADRIAIGSNNLLTLALGGSMQASGSNGVQVGAEDLLYSFLALRAGYQANINSSELDPTSGFSAGLGFRYQSFSVDYAYTPFGDLGFSQRLSIGYHFGEEVSSPSAEPARQELPAAKHESKLHQAQDMVRQQRYIEAISLFQESIAAKENQTEAWRGLAELYSTIGKKDAALNAFRQVLKFNADDAEAKAWLAAHK